MRKIIIFSGTTEGRVLSEHLAGLGFECHVLVATEYGETVSPKGKNILVRVGRLDEKAMCDTFKVLRPEYIVDATHPYAVEVSKNIASAARTVGINFLRLLRDEAVGTDEALSKADVTIVPDITSAAKTADAMKGNIFVSTGSKELSAFTQEITDKERITARILPARESMELAYECGLSAGQIIGMKGPFSKAINLEMFKATESMILVTKDGGKSGGFAEKIEAASELSMKVIVIKKPSETGLSFEEVCRVLKVPSGSEKTDEGDSIVKISIVGIGVGSDEQLTGAARQCISEANAVIGARRMLEAVKESGIISERKETVAEYDAKKIKAAIKDNPQWKKIAIAVSGDVGFYSGCAGLLAELSGEEVELIPGISSMVYFCSKIKQSWEDMAFVSCHGRKNSILNKIAKNKKLFAIFSDASQIRAVANGLTLSKRDNVKMYVGCNLSYEDEKIISGRPADFELFSFDGLVVAAFVNESPDHLVSYGLSDESFERGDAPMTKEEIRAVSLSKLALKRDSVLLDIGAGTGSVSIEAARICDTGFVYAIEKKAEAAKLIEKNATRFCLDNIEVICGFAPDVFEGAPEDTAVKGIKPTHAFIGGSSGNMEQIIDAVWSMNPMATIVINTITMESLAECMNIIKKNKLADADIVTVNVSKNKQLGAYNLMNALNPVTIITLKKETVS